MISAQQKSVYYTRYVSFALQLYADHETEVGRRVYLGRWDSFVCTDEIGLTKLSPAERIHRSIHP